jgi:acetyltransferase
VGVSADPAKAGSQALRSLAGFPGKLVAVHPREREIQGFSCYPSIAELPEAVDLAIFAIPAQHCPKAAAEAASRGIGGVFIISGGFGESGEEGARLQKELADICASTGLRLLGPNTSGFINPHARCIASFVPGVDRLPAGNVAVVAQSGGVNLSLSFLIERLGEGISLAVGLGNAVDVQTADILDMLADDLNTSAIALHLEGVTDGRHLFEVLRQVTPRKPVIALVAGRADIGEFAVSHTGNLMGSRQRTVSALEQAGAIVVDTTEELAQAAVVLSYGRLPPKARNGFALITCQAGPGLLIADTLKSRGVEMPILAKVTIESISALLPPMTFVKNPVDTGRPGPGFPKVVETAARDAAIDAVLVFGLSEPSVLDPEAALLPAAKASGKPVVFGTLGLANDIAPSLIALRAVRLPVAIGPERLALAAIVLDADSRGQWLLSRQRPSNTANAKQLFGIFDESLAKQLVASYGIDIPQSRLCLSRAETREAFATLRRPVVVKIAASDVPHKSDVGGVVVNVSEEIALEAACDKIAAIPTSEPGRVLIEEMASTGVDLIVGGVRDPSWGPLVMIGLGGVTAEALSDSSVRLAPLVEDDVEAMLDSLRGRKLFEGFRGLPVCDRAAIARVAIAMGRLLCEHPEIAEAEINPLRVNASGAMALDALVVLASP